MKKKLLELLAARKTQVEAMEHAAMDTDSAAFDAAKAQVEALNSQIARVQAAMDEAERFGEPVTAAAPGLADMAAGKAGAPAGQEPRASREYARAFCNAIRAQARGKAGDYHEAMTVIRNALTESSGSPAGADGGFLVPVDMDTTIRQLRRDLQPLAGLFTTEIVTAAMGYRVIDKHPSAGFTKVAEMGVIPKDDQPEFDRIVYAVEDYALRVPVSNDLLADNDAGLMAYLSGWFARKGVIAENRLLLALLSALDKDAATLAAGKQIAGLKSILNKTLDPAIAAAAVILTNQDGFDQLDQLEDKNGRPLLQPDPTGGTANQLFRRPVHVVSNQVLATKDHKIPFYIGDFTQYGVLFRRQPLEVTSTSVGGDAWATNSTEVRGILRMDAKVLDAQAAAAAIETTAADA